MPDAFRPVGTVSLAVSGTSSAVAIPVFQQQLELQNAGDVIVFVRLGATSPTAVVTDYPVLPGQSKLITSDRGNAFIAGITASGTATLYITYGLGA